MNAIVNVMIPHAASKQKKPSYNVEQKFWKICLISFDSEAK